MKRGEVYKVQVLSQVPDRDGFFKITGLRPKEKDQILEAITIDAAAEARAEKIQAKHFPTKPTASFAAFGVQPRWFADLIESYFGAEVEAMPLREYLAKALIGRAEILREPQ